MDDEIDIAPVDAEIERRGGDNGAQFARRHCRFHLAPLCRVKRAVMERDRQMILIGRPQSLECHLRLRARVDEDECHARLLDRLVEFGDRIAR